ncbi:hypothetical protein NE237_028575 [Protea cynaroides]|uniref:Uncharacterized protein n=1 Tax=Protea cynaroides TaxID=273540 RepID=A0A9Q0GSA4_9MAGN|nr:hypothetical protein NE237_028575 [Protea cynaroides]
MTKAVEEYKALDELKDYVAELDTLYDLKHEISTPTFWKALHLLSNYVGKTAGDDFDFFGFEFNIDAPTDSDEAEDAPNKAEAERVVTEQSQTVANLLAKVEWLYSQVSEVEKEWNAFVETLDKLEAHRYKQVGELQSRGKEVEKSRDGYHADLL